MALFSSMMNRRGIALLNMVFIFIFIAVLVGAGLKMYGSIVARGKITDSKKGLDTQARMIAAWSAKNGRLPATTPTDEYAALFGSAPLDSWGRPITYLYDANLAATSTGGICGKGSTALSFMGTGNVAFILLSGGENPSLQSTLNGTLNGASFNGAINASGPATGSVTPAVVPLNNSNDLIRFVTLYELQALAGCFGPTGGHLTIMNNELPQVCSGSATYNATVFANGGVPPYSWTVSNAPAWLLCNGSACGGTLSNPTLNLSVAAGQTAAAVSNLTFSLADSTGATIARTLPINLATSGCSGTTPSGGIDTTPPEPGAPNNPSSELLAENVITNTPGLITVENNVIAFGYDTNNGSACIWYPYNFPLLGKTLRAYWNFCFANSDTSPTSTNYADGYTFAIMQGSNPTTYCGTGTIYDPVTNPYFDCVYSGHLGEFLSYCGLPGQSIATEFDIYPSAARNDPTGSYNHVAIVKSTSTHSGPPQAGTYGDNTHNVGGNPACNNGTNPASGCVFGSAKGVTWLENGCNANKDNHNARVEVHTRCNSTCSSCGTESCSGTPTSCASGYRVWNEYNNTGRPFAVSGWCNPNVNLVIGDEITDASHLLTSGGTISRYPGSATNCSGAASNTITYNQAVAADANGDCQISYGPTNTAIDREGATAAQYALVKVWIDKGNNNLASNDASSPDISYCTTLDPALNQIKAGFTQATGAAHQLGYISNFVLNSYGSCPRPAMSPLALPSARTGSAYSATVTASGGTAPYTWNVANLPAGLNFTPSTGLISGTLSTAGTYNTILISVTDSCTADVCANTASLSYTIKVCPALSISTSSISSGYAGTSYSQTMASSGGTAPVSWSATGLPPGLAISASGVISGTPTAIGSYTPTVTATDACGSSVAVTRSYTLQIQPTPAPTCTLTPGTSLVDYNSSTNLNWTITNGPANGVWAASPGGTCTNVSNSSGGTCTTGSLATPGTITYTLTVSNANGTNSCNATLKVGCSGYRVWNTTGGSADFTSPNGTCRNSLTNGSEITTTGNLLGPGGDINRDNQSGWCNASSPNRITYSQAVAGDTNGNCQVNYNAGDAVGDR